ncbi:MAG: hypothetical protein R3233_00680 [Xanthomonadales bacterium]|nr:hypothetical protein [Xanthomonadales bacterium]
MHAGSVAALERFFAHHPEWLDGPLVLDSGCGTGDSVAALAEKHPGARVLGIDKSVHRLSRCGHPIGDAAGRSAWLRCDAPTAWRWLVDQDIRLEAHYLLYPNPWPKPSQLMRRWHAHPAWPSLLALGGALEMRCNWRVYAEEFALALRWSGIDAAGPERLAAPVPMTRFEAKYAASGHSLWRVTAPSVRVARRAPAVVPGFGR